MRTVLRNRELRRELGWFGLLTLVFAAASSLLIGLRAGFLSLVGGLSATGLYLCFILLRYRKMQELADSIDRVLHGQDAVLISQSREGELSILRNEIQKLTIRLGEQADRLRDDKLSLSKAIADVSHQLRTPLTGMNLTVNRLSKPDLSDAERRELLQTHAASLRRLDWLVEALLKLSKLDAGTVRYRIQTVRAASLLDQALEPYRIALELREIEVLTVCADETLICDPAWTVEAMGNLIKNCMEHTPAGGNIVVTVSQTPIFTEFTVEDTGSGFDPADLPHLFERFYKGKNAAPESVGIGLALSREILAAQNATITADNRPDASGARFRVRFYPGVV